MNPGLRGEEAVLVCAAVALPPMSDTPNPRTSPSASHDSFIRVWRESFMTRDSFIWVAWLIHQCGVTDSSERWTRCDTLHPPTPPSASHRLFLRETWLMQRCVTSDIYRCVTWLIRVCADTPLWRDSSRQLIDDIRVFVSHDSFIRATCDWCRVFRVDLMPAHHHRFTPL